MRNNLPHPVLLRPHYVAKPWGGRRFETRLGRSNLPTGAVGESWEIADTEEACSLIEGGPLDGVSLREVWGGPFPLLIKILDARSDLSVQLHPDGVDSPLIKEEAWVSLDRSGAVVTGAIGTNSIPKSGQWVEKLKRTPLSFPRNSDPTPPTMVHVPAGTVHAILADSLVFEVQNPVNVTWRLDDYGRLGLDGELRELHVDQALPVLGRGPRGPGWLDPNGRRLKGERFQIELHEPATAAMPCGPVVFALSQADVSWGMDERFVIPPGRTALVPNSVKCVVSETWWISCAAVLT